MEFKQFRDYMIDHMNNMFLSDMLFRTNADGDKLWDLYLDSFPAGTNPIYRTTNVYDCSECKRFVRAFGNVVIINGNNDIVTVWDFDTHSDVFQPVVDALAAYVKQHKVTDRFATHEAQIGVESNREELEDGSIRTYYHMYTRVPNKYVFYNKSAGDEVASFRDTRYVFERSITEISMDAVNTVLELIESNSLYRGPEWHTQIQMFRDYKLQYDMIDESKRDNWLWRTSINVGSTVGRIRNHSIGTLLTDISEGIDLEHAVSRYENIVAGPNYKRPKAIYTKKMLDDARQKFVEMGYMNSLKRCFASIDDITVNNVLFSNRDAVKRVSDDNDVFSKMGETVTINPKSFNNIIEIDVNDFITNILPAARNIEVFVENKHTKNFVSMIAPIDGDSKSMFKWNNALSWAYTGNIADSVLKQNVKSAGGNVNGILRFSIQWNDSLKDETDLDAHCIEPTGNEIYFGNYKYPEMSKLSGQLDVDVIVPSRDMPGKPAVENIVYTDLSRMKPGVYKFFVYPFNINNSKGFSAEIEADGEIYSFEYPHPVTRAVTVADVILNNDNTFTVKEMLKGSSSTASKTFWNINTNRFTPVSAISYSPNYFDEQEGVGNKHLFFFLKGCVSNEEPNGFYNEFINNELNEHRRVLEALGSECHVSYTEDQLSGIGFCLSRRGDLVVKVNDGSNEKLMRIKF